MSTAICRSAARSSRGRLLSRNRRNATDDVSATGLFEWDGSPTAQRQHQGLMPLAPFSRCKREVVGEGLGMRAIALRLIREARVSSGRIPNSSECSNTDIAQLDNLNYQFLTVVTG